MHPRNKHQSRYNFKQLVSVSPELGKFVFVNKYKDETIDFSLPDAVKALNQALLKSFYGLKYWDIPRNFLCPPIPGRADYIHYVADLLATSFRGKIPGGENVLVWDVGTGANCIYPLIGNQEYGWHFIGSDIDASALASATDIIKRNNLERNIELRLQPNKDAIFQGIQSPHELFDITVCNPPFHKSAAEAAEGSERKMRNLGVKSKELNFGGKGNELWCSGGEQAFIERIIDESKTIGRTCLWFTTLVSKKENLAKLEKQINQAGARDLRVLEMAQGQKVSRLLAWSYFNQTEQESWADKRWKEK